MKKYLLIDSLNMFFRAKHVAHRKSTLEEKIGFCIHTILAGVAKCWREQKADHVIICLDGHSWRKEFYPPYKQNRAAARMARTETEEFEDAEFFKAYTDLINFFEKNTNCTILQHDDLEADDCIAGWIQAHPDDHHTIISSDSDYVQLLAPNVNQYNGITDELWKIDGIFDYKGKRVTDKKTKEPKVVPDPQWILFLKCMRGDTSDNVFSAYPGVREKGSKKGKVGVREAFDDKNKKGFAWNNMMLQRWTDHNKVEHRVLDDYERNRILIDLTAQPVAIKEKIHEAITSQAKVKDVPQIGVRFLKFCGKHELIKLSESSQQFATILSAGYI